MVHDSALRRIGLIGASFATGNMGVGALAAGAIRCIHHRWPGAEVFILDYAKTRSRHNLRIGNKELRIEVVNLRFSKRLQLANNVPVLIAIALALRLMPSRRVREWLATMNDTMGEICRCDLFASVAGGDSFSDIYGLRRFLYIAWPQILIILVGQRLVLLPQTFGPFRSRLARVIARFITRNAEAIYARDQLSVAELERLHRGRKSGPIPTVRYDVAFALEPTAPSVIRIDGQFDMTLNKVVGLNVSGLLYMGGYSRSNMFHLTVDYRDLVQRLLDVLIRVKGATVLLVPHVFGEEESSESDSVASSTLYLAYAAKYGAQLGLLRGYYDQGEIKHVIGMCDFFIGSRMHACIAAVSQCVPSVAIAYSDKFVGVMASIGHGSIVADARKLKMDELLTWVTEAYDGRSATLRQLQHSMPEVTRSALSLFGDPHEESSGANVSECSTSV